MPLYEKIAYYKLHLDGSYSSYVDKIEIKSIIQTQCNSIQCAKIIRILDTITDISEKDLGSHTILKGSHGSGMNIPLYDKTQEDIPSIVNKLKEWNTVYIGNDEPHYSFIQPRFFIEECIDDYWEGKTSNATVFLIRCIKGIPVTVSIKKGNKQNSYDMSWNPIRKLELPPIQKPDDLEELILIAKELSNPFEFVRVDLYKGKDGYYFSEYTFTPAGGNPYFSLEKEKELGKLWT